MARESWLKINLADLAAIIIIYMVLIIFSFNSKTFLRVFTAPLLALFTYSVGYLVLMYILSILFRGKYTYVIKALTLAIVISVFLMLTLKVYGVSCSKLTYYNFETNRFSKKCALAADNNGCIKDYKPWYNEMGCSNDAEKFSILNKKNLTSGMKESCNSICDNSRQCDKPAVLNINLTCTDFYGLLDGK